MFIAIEEIIEKVLEKRSNKNPIYDGLSFKKVAKIMGERMRTRGFCDKEILGGIDQELRSLESGEVKYA